MQSKKSRSTRGCTSTPVIHSGIRHRREHKRRKGRNTRKETGREKRNRTSHTWVAVERWPWPEEPPAIRQATSFGALLEADLTAARCWLDTQRRSCCRWWHTFLGRSTRNFPSAAWRIFSRDDYVSSTFGTNLDDLAVQSPTDALGLSIIWQTFCGTPIIELDESSNYY